VVGRPRSNTTPANMNRSQRTFVLLFVLASCAGPKESASHSPSEPIPSDTHAPAGTTPNAAATAPSSTAAPRKPAASNTNDASLFDGKTLHGWVTRGGHYDGDADWSIEDHAITGRQGPK